MNHDPNDLSSVEAALDTYFDDVRHFHEKFDLPNELNQAAPGFPDELTPADRDMLREAARLVERARDLLRTNPKTEFFRAAFALEEVTEHLRAVEDRDLEGVADAIADQVYVALGTAHFYAIPFEEVWDEVHRANMAKERGRKTPRGHGYDVGKPPGWKAPDVAGALRRAGYIAIALLAVMVTGGCGDMPKVYYERAECVCKTHGGVSHFTLVSLDVLSDQRAAVCMDGTVVPVG